MQLQLRAERHDPIESCTSTTAVSAAWLRLSERRRSAARASIHPVPAKPALRYARWRSCLESTGMAIVRWVGESAIALVKEVVVMFGTPLLWFFKVGAMACWLIAPFALLNVWMAAPGSSVRETTAVITHLMPLAMAILSTFAVIGLRQLIRRCLDQGDYVFL
jgi:hypothetical protein